MSDFFQKACCSFFNLEYSSVLLIGQDAAATTQPQSFEKDEFWQVSRDEIYRALELAFNRDWKSFLPRLKVPSHQTFLQYAKDIAIAKSNVSSVVSNITTDYNTKETTIQNSNLLPSVAFIGKMKSGKSTATRHLCEKYGYVEYYFAKPLKLGVQQLFSLSNSQLHEVDEKNNIDPRWGVSPRYLFQQIGTDLFRNQLHIYLPQIQSCWIQNFFRWWKKINNTNHKQPVIVSDCRFQNEVDAVESVGIKTFRIVRGLLTDSAKCTEINVEEHQSETDQDKVVVNFTIENNSTLLHFFKTIDEVIINPTLAHQNVE